jgi:hypothetical protein
MKIIAPSVDVISRATPSSVVFAAWFFGGFQIGIKSENS